jgi:hypothetical protein
VKYYTLNVPTLDLAPEGSSVRAALPSRRKFIFPQEDLQEAPSSFDSSYFPPGYQEPHLIQKSELH